MISSAPPAAVSARSRSRRSRGRRCSRRRAKRSRRIGTTEAQRHRARTKPRRLLCDSVSLITEHARVLRRFFPIHSPRITQMARMVRGLPAFIRDICVICGQHALVRALVAAAPPWDFFVWIDSPMTCLHSVPAPRTPHSSQGMKDSIVHEVRDARTAVAADFDFELPKFFAWAKAHTAAERKVRHWLPINPGRSLEATGRASKSVMARKHLVRPAAVPAKPEQFSSTTDGRR